ncbi:MAG TPA: amidohydrolase [Acidobacteriota bacterium]|jgi:hypothetical protein
MSTRFLVFSLSFSLLAAAAGEKADLVVLNGKVLTVDNNFTIARAAAIRNDRFVAVGTDTQIKEWIGPQTRVLDAQGKTVIPGIIESHSHAVDVSRSEAAQPYEEMTSIAAIQDWIRRAAAKKPPGEWIIIPRSYPTRLREHRFPTRAELDAADARHPVVFDGAYSHVLNTAALNKAGIRRDSPPLQVGEIDRNADGEPTGLLRNAGKFLSQFLPTPSVPASKELEILEKVHRVYLSCGITSVMERGATVNDYHLYEQLRNQGRLVVRSRVTIRLPGTTAEEAESFIRNLPFKPGAGDEWVTAGPLKIVVDGGILIGTAYMREPYGRKAMPLYNLRDPNYRGSLSLTPDSVTALITTGHRLGWQMASHVTGDAGVDIVLDAVEAAGRVRPIENSRFNLIHAYFPDKRIVERARKLGVYVDTQPAWYYKDADSLLPALGVERMRRFIGVRDWIEGGVPVVANTDHMFGLDPNSALNPFNPFLTLYVLVTRKTEGGQVIGPEQRASRQDALKMMTRNAAALTFDEKTKGSIEVGKLGDLVILSDDYLACAPEKIKLIRADTTVIGGRVVYQRNQNSKVNRDVLIARLGRVSGP